MSSCKWYYLDPASVDSKLTFTNMWWQIKSMSLTVNSDANRLEREECSKWLRCLWLRSAHPHFSPVQVMGELSVILLSVSTFVNTSGPTTLVSMTLHWIWLGSCWGSSISPGSRAPTRPPVWHGKTEATCTSVCVNEYYECGMSDNVLCNEMNAKLVQ